MAESGRLRIGEFSRRTGVSPELLRAWETRYGLMDPERTAGGLRLYSEEDARRVRVMSKQIASGLSAAEAARVALDSGIPDVTPDRVLADLDQTLGALDEPAAQVALDRAFRALPLDTVIVQVVLPFLRTLGERWAVGERTVAQEHFASNLIGGRLRALARGWGEGRGPRALLACPPGEQHELGLLCFGLLLRERKWRIAYLGAATPMTDDAITDFAPDVVVLTATAPQRLLDAADDIRALGARARVVIGGAGASEALAERLGVEVLPSDILEAVHVLQDRQ
jgi:DNA-binding transcriptional MerR regulator